MNRVVTATEARIHFGELIRRVAENRETVIVERAGKPQVVVLAMAEYERLLGGPNQEKQWMELVQLARDQIRAELGDRELPRPEEIIRRMREDRDEQLMGMRGR